MKRELLSVFTLVKVGRAQFQVLKQEKNQGSSMDAGMEYIFVKGIEFFAEAIPCTVLQMFALILNKDGSAMQIVSLLISAITTGFASSFMTYIIDTSIIKRSNSGR
jgi:hypothetical protein